MSPTNVSVIEGMYEAFGRGDLPAVIDALADDVDWFFPGPPAIPFAGRRQGKEAVQQFLLTLVQTMVFEQFEPREFVEAGNQVVTLGRERAKVGATGKRFESDWAHVFDFAGGKIQRVREFYDTATMVEAFTG